jgi:prepilin-type N-terminal cleavage/methylation domain-containing protein
MNKKGFTLVELSISVTLLSLVMVFMFKFLSDIRKDEDLISFRTEMLLNKSIISKNINEDIREAGGISTLSCTSSKCSIGLKDNTLRELEIINKGAVLSYKNVSTNRLDFTRKLPSGYVFNFSKVENSQVFVLSIIMDSKEEYNVDIVSQKS